MEGNKAQGLSMSILVVAAIAVMVLLVLGLFFTGGFKTISGSMNKFISGTSGDKTATNISACSAWCANAESGYRDCNPGNAEDKYGCADYMCTGQTACT